MGSLASDVPQGSPWKKIFAMKTTLVLSVVLAAVAAKFCPGERNGNECRAGDNALKKAKKKDEAKEILGADVTEESFNNFPGCQASAANARCYTTLNKQRSVPLDSCDRNLINTSGSETIGDYLCKQVRRWKKNDSNFKANGIKNLKLPFYYSACNGPWEPVTNSGADLYADEDLCCNPDGTFFRCDGSDFNQFC